MTMKPCVTHPELIRLLERAAKHKMTPREIWLQRVSFVWGNLPEECTTTRADVEKHCAEIYGECPA